MYPATPSPSLEILIATHRSDGIGRVAQMNLPVMEEVRYIISWQHADGLQVPESLSSRHDITVLICPREGVSANRNNLLDYASAPFVLIADDDLIYTRESILGALAIMREHPEVDYFSFRYDGPDNKSYPTNEANLATLPKGFYQTAFEVGINRRGKGAELRFNEFFGPGAQMFTTGEDEILLYTARKTGLSCRFFPFTLCTHPTLTTGSRASVTDGFYRSHGAVIAANNPRSYPLRLIINAWRSSRLRNGSFFHIWKLMRRGARHARSAQII